MEAIVSVIIPTYKGADRLPRALASILEQTYKPLEVIVVDDNEPDSADRSRTEALMDEYLQRDNMSYIRQAESGNRAAARNTGIAVSTGSYLCFLDDCDFYLSGRIEKSLRHLEENPGYDGVVCGVAITGKEKLDSVSDPGGPLDQKDLLLDETILCTGSNIFLRRSAVETAGGFDELFSHLQDKEFMLRILGSFGVLKMEEIMIVKPEIDKTFPSDYRNLRKQKELYMLKFEEVIGRLEPEELLRFYIQQYEDLFHAALVSGRNDYISQSLMELKIFRDISLKDRLHILVNKKYLTQKKIYRKLQHIRYQRRNRSISLQNTNGKDPLIKEAVLNVFHKPGSVEKTQNNKF